MRSGRRERRIFGRRKPARRPDKARQKRRALRHRRNRRKGCAGFVRRNHGAALCRFERILQRSGFLKRRQPRALSLLDSRDHFISKPYFLFVPCAPPRGLAILAYERRYGRYAQRREVAHQASELLFVAHADACPNPGSGPFERGSVLDAQTGTAFVAIFNVAFVNGAFPVRNAYKLVRSRPQSGKCVTAFLIVEKHRPAFYARRKEKEMRGVRWECPG